jgi:NADPH:quinone reductase-like Zn-dependent oxidoreductase
MSHRWKSDPHGPEGPYAILGGTKFLPEGCCQEFLAVSADEIELVPYFMTDAEAAATPLAALTAWRATMIKADVQAGQNVLVTGIGGGVALFCLQFALAQGANVYVTSGSEEKVNKAKALGAKDGVDYKDKDWEKTLLAILPEERPYLDSVIDSAGGDIVFKAFKLLRAGGIISTYGMTLGPKVVFPMAAVMKNIEVMSIRHFTGVALLNWYAQQMKGSTMGSRKEFKELVEFIRVKRIQPVVSSVHAFDKVEDAFEIMKAGTNFGKLVIQITNDSAKL